MYIPMQSRYSDFQDYYPPLNPPHSPSSSPRSISLSPSHSPSLPPRSPSLAPSSLHAARRTSNAYPYRSSNAPPAPPTSIPLDDNFDAPTTEAPTEWALRSHAGDGHPEYEESVTGYQNYVVEMERMLEGQMESAARAQERMRQAIRERERQTAAQQDANGGSRQRKTSMSPTLRRIDTSISESARGGSSRPGGGGGSGQRGHGSHAHARSPMSAAPVPVSPPPENARQVSGKKGRLELVEQRVLEDSAARTISLWRERVAASSAGGSRCGESNVDGGDGRDVAGSRAERGGGDGRSEAGSHAHRRMPSRGSASGDPRLRRVVSDQARYASSVHGGGSRNGSVRAPDGGKPRRASASYERSEYMVSYHNAKGGFPKEVLHPLSEAGSVPSTRQHRPPSSPTKNKTHYVPPPSPSLRRHAARRSLDRNEYMITYPQTPPLTGSQASSGSPTGKRPQHSAQSPPPLRSPLHGSFRDMRDALTPPSDTSALKVTTTSSVEAILAACDPSLLHIAPILQELGIKRVDHLRAVARLSEETRDREVKEQALRRGVTVVEWAIFLDKLQSL
ncbi:hypothetical protein BV20DRAFT_978481 [Pilatotrama ljubarskyi]|nr:hypothetical protein BV20DRAFT_978481 [Pilatotrama ljubarskyi]